jgi:hypothetical protein
LREWEEHVKTPLRVHTVVVDECGCTPESSTALLLNLRPKNLVLLGDHKQLPPCSLIPPHALRRVLFHPSIGLFRHTFDRVGPFQLTGALSYFRTERPAVAEAPRTIGRCSSGASPRAGARIDSRRSTACIRTCARR